MENNFFLTFENKLALNLYLVPSGSHTSYSSSLVGSITCKNHGYDGQQSSLVHPQANHQLPIRFAVKPCPLFITDPGWRSPQIQPEEEEFVHESHSRSHRSGVRKERRAYLGLGIGAKCVCVWAPGCSLQNRWRNQDGSTSVVRCT